MRSNDTAEGGLAAHVFQRRVLGACCGLLAPACVLFGLLGAEGNLDGWYKSVSATYYANSKLCMIGLLFATAVFFFSYRGYDWRDRLMSVIQGAAALGIIMFPCMAPGIPDRVGLFYLPCGVSARLHNMCAGVLFIAFATNIMFLFTMGDSGNPMKRRRNRVYRACAGIIYAFCAAQALSVMPLMSWVPGWFPLTWLNELVMLEAFAVAWLAKSGAFGFLND